jgi:hypothetical protein
MHETAHIICVHNVDYIVKIICGPIAMLAIYNSIQLFFDYRNKSVTRIRLDNWFFITYAHIPNPIYVNTF